MERVKAMQRNASAAAEPERYRPEVASDDEPRYLRRQKPVEIRRRKFSGKSLSLYRRVFLWVVIAVAFISVATIAGRFLLYSPQMLLTRPDQIDLDGNHFVAREVVLDRFYRDRGRSVLQVPLDKRRSEIEQISWVESASVQRILPNHIRVGITERTPVAFLRNGSEIALIDAHGVILDRPQGEDFHFPIVTGISDSMSREERERRMQVYADFVKSVELVRAHSSEDISEADLSNPKDLRVVMAGFPGAQEAQAVTIHFGNSDFAGKYNKIVENFAQWQAKLGCLQSVDLQYKYPVTNPDPNGCGASQGTHKK